MISSLSQLVCRAKSNPKVIAIAAADDPVVLSAAKEAAQQGIASFILFGSQGKIEEIINEMDFAENLSIVDCASKSESIQKAVEAVSLKSADILMKGNVKTGELLSVFLKDEYGLRTGRTMNLVTVFETKKYHKLILVTDAGMVIAPDLGQKADSIINSAAVARALEIEKPKVAVLAAIEVVNSKMPATTDAAILSQMARRDQLGAVEVDGPLALDNAISFEAAKHKGISSSVAGDADILIMPDIEAGNIFYKAMAFLSDCQLASAIVGGRIPIILTSRADSASTKLQSIALNVLLSGVM
ncbi:bifunctional enoyl-CoA hydratase/phosphate acetyltransferase [Mesotoga sp. UBA6090]|uniref:bifunctional enoyl-CoA hydratase/phosphate acetyltransferase n=1 Tax=Mesotoga sp. UBA6090 TaxID=1946860 RepID=UPI0025F80287|nr:bifunctional enoyl-CoA hydratase/phosphate acetyltransferase [Mesotoga sp. UBA6090]